MQAVPATYRDLFDATAFLTLVTLSPEGWPHPTPVWVGYDDGSGDAPWSGEDPAILVNTTTAREKYRNVREDPRVGGTIMDPEDPYRYVSFRGTVVATETEDADEHIDALARRYMDVDRYPNRGDEEGDRVILRIAPERFF